MVAESLKKWNTPALRKYVSDHNKVIRFHIGKEIKEARVAYSKFLKVKRRDLKAAQEINIKGMKKNQIIEAILKEPVLVNRIKGDIDNKRAPAGFHYMKGGVIMKGDKHGGEKKEEGGGAKERKKIQLTTFYDDEPKKSNLKTVTKEDPKISKIEKQMKRSNIIGKVKALGQKQVIKKKALAQKIENTAKELKKKQIKAQAPKKKELPKTPLTVTRADGSVSVLKKRVRDKRSILDRKAPAPKPAPKPKPALDPEKKRRIQVKVKDLGRRAIDKKIRQGESIGQAAYKMKNEKTDLYKYVKNNLDPTKSEEKQPKLIQELIEVYIQESLNTGDRFGEHGIYRDRKARGKIGVDDDEFFAGYDDKTDEYGTDTKKNKLAHREYIKKRMLEEIRDGMMDIDDVTESGFTEEDLKEKAPAPKKKIQIKKTAPKPKPAPKKEEPKEQLDEKKYPREKMIKKYNLKVGDKIKFTETRSNIIATITKLGDKTMSWKTDDGATGFSNYRTLELDRNLGQEKAIKAKAKPKPKPISDEAKKALQEAREKAKIAQKERDALKGKKPKLIKEIPSRLKEKWFRYMVSQYDDEPFSPKDQLDEYEQLKELADEYFENQEIRRDKSLKAAEQAEGGSRVMSITETLKEIINDDEDNNKKLIKALFPKLFDALYK